MFVDAIERVNPFTQPMHSIVRLYGHSEIVPGTATLFFINEEGCAITCKHVAELIRQSDPIYHKYREFQGARREALREKNAAHLISQLEAKFQLTADTIIRVRNNFISCVDQFQKLSIDHHPTQDLALLRFEGYNRLLYRSHAVFWAIPVALSRAGVYAGWVIRFLNSIISGITRAPMISSGQQRVA